MDQMFNGDNCLTRCCPWWCLCMFLFFPYPDSPKSVAQVNLTHFLRWYYNTTPLPSPKCARTR